MRGWVPEPNAQSLPLGLIPLARPQGKPHRVASGFGSSGALEIWGGNGTPCAEQATPESGVATTEGRRRHCRSPIGFEAEKKKKEKKRGTQETKISRRGRVPLPRSPYLGLAENGGRESPRYCRPSARGLPDGTHA